MLSDATHARLVVVLAGSVVAAVAAFGAPPLSVQLPLLAAAVLVLGVPHGALDHRPAERLLAPRWGRGRWWVVFLVGYLALAVVVLAAFAVAPRASLAAFLLLSIVHFGLDAPRDGGRLRWARLLAWGAPPIVLPCALQAEETAALFSIVAGAPVAPSRVATLGLVGTVLWLAAWATTAPASRLHALRLALYLPLFAVAPPLVAFTVYFCADHSLRCLLDEAREVGSPRALVREALPAVVATAGLAAAAFVLSTRVGAATIDEALLRVVFQGLAALTLPHMVLWWLDTRFDAMVPA